MSLGGSIIGALRFILGADSAQLEAASGRASKALQLMSRAGETAGKQIVSELNKIGGVLVTAFATERIIAFTAESISAAAAIGRFADQAGLSAQQFQGLEFALRDAQVPTEQLAQGFAIFSRNLSDLERGTGPFLDFLRRFAPELENQFRATTSTAEAFGVLTDAVNAFGSQQDRVRLLNAAGAEQFGRLANSMRQGRAAMEEVAGSALKLTDAQIESARDIEKRWDELWRNFRTRAQTAILAVAETLSSMGRRGAPTFDTLQRSLGVYTRQLAEAQARGQDTTQIWGQINKILEMQAKLFGDVADEAARAANAPPPNLPRALTPDQIRAAQNELSLLMNVLQGLPQQADFVSLHFRAAWEKMQQVIKDTSQTELEASTAIAAARMNLLRQEESARLQALGNAVTAAEQFRRRETDLFNARSQELITEAEFQRALALAQSEARMGRMQELQGLGVTLSAWEQYQLSIERTTNALSVGRITAEQSARAHQAAALSMAASYASALSGIGQNFAAAFENNKAIAAASVVINTAAAVIKSLAEYGYTPLGIAAAAAAAAAGVAQLSKINSTSIGGGGSVAPAVGGGGAVSAPPVSTAAGLEPSQSLLISIQGGTRYTPEEVAQIVEAINNGVVNNHVRLIATKIR
jgi:hypothetical protein